MEVVLSTGGDQDFLELRAENLKDAVSLYNLSTSRFMREPHRLKLVTNSTTNSMVLQIKLSDVQPSTPQEQAEVNVLHDLEA